MSFLTPLYALAGVAIALPILFHLVRRRPKERKLVSSLMFLDPTPPRLTRQSRIDQWLLMLLRAAAIGLLAIAFTRPYWNIPAEKDADKVGTQRMVLIDTSASMQREGLWKSALQRAEQAIRQSGPTDIVSVYAFDSSLRPVVDIDSATQTAASQRQIQALSSLQNLTPTWKHTDLGLALMSAADLMQTDRDASSESNATTSEIVVITDFQNGADVERLAEYSWPASCRVRIERVEATALGNARAIVMEAEDAGIAFKDTTKTRTQTLAVEANKKDEIEKARVRVSNSVGAKVDAFRLSWLSEKLEPMEGTQTNCQVPAGSALTVRMPVPPKGAIALQLDGDGSNFDNRYYVTTKDPLQSNLMCVEASGIAPDASLGYFLQKIPIGDVTRTVQFQSRVPGLVGSWPNPDETPLIVASHALSDSDIVGLKTFVEQGGHLLWVMDAAASNGGESSKGAIDYSVPFQQLVGVSDAKITESKVRQYGMLESVNFKHPLFADLADSKFNDFSKIRFWKHRKLESKQLDAWETLAKFDDGSPALISKLIGSGRIWILMAGWQPNESQLALSTKFVPIVLGMYRMATPALNNAAAYRVGMSIELPEESRMFGPDGKEILPPKQDGKPNRNVELLEPGMVRRVSASGAEAWMAVNLTESESNTAVAGIERLEKLGVMMKENKIAPKDETTKRQLRAVELESQQGWWRWVLVGVIGIIGLESLLCIRKAG